MSAALQRPTPMPAGTSAARNNGSECDNPTKLQPAAAKARPRSSVRRTPTILTIGATIPTCTITPRNPNAAST